MPASEHSAALHFLFQNSRICFNGHSHVPIIAFHTPGEHVNLQRFGGMFTLPPDHNVLVGVGSVGQPRDGDYRPSYVLYDSATGEIDPRRVPFVV